MDASAVIAIIGVVVTVLLAVTGALIVVAVRAGRVLQKVDSIEQWMNERDARVEDRLYRLEQAVELTPPPREPTGPRATVGRARVAKPVGAE